MHACWIGVFVYECYSVVQCCWQRWWLYGENPLRSSTCSQWSRVRQRQAQPCVGRHGRRDAACFASSPPLKRERERERETFPSPSPLLSAERFSSHLLSKTATIGVTSPTRSSWSCWAAVCACKCLCVLSDSMLSWNILLVTSLTWPVPSDH